MKRIALLAAIIHFILASIVFAQSTQIEGGLDYLYSTSNPDGSWGRSGSLKNLPTTATVIETLQLLNETNSPNYTNALSWLQSQSLDTTDYLSERIYALSVAGGDSTLLLSYIDSASYAWGGYDDYDVNILDTALALQALKAANCPDLSIINYGLAYLTSSQNSDGGWGFCSSSDLGCSDSTSNVYVTALVSATLQQFPQTTTIATAISKATSYLMMSQNIDGGFGTAGTSTVYETALSYTALVAVSTDTTVLGNAINYLTSTQLSDGSWDEDPYSTALALRALCFSGNKPAPPPPAPVTGTLMGTVVDAVTRQPLKDVTATLVSDSSLTATTDNSGVFMLGNLPDDAQQITLLLSGYAQLTITTKIIAGAFINVGTISLSVNPTTGIIQGTVWDADANAPFFGVEILVLGNGLWSTRTAADGTYKITDVSPGTVTISTPFLSKPGYYGAPFTGALAPGGILIYSPVLSTTPPPGGLKGTVVDSSSSLPIKGATITLSPAPEGITLPAVTDESGAFSIPGIAVGSYTAEVAASGYLSQSFTVSILARGETNVNVPLLPRLATNTISGKIADASTGSPIALAIVSIVGTNIFASTAADGTFSLSGITALNFTVRASATGYNSLNYGVTTTDYGVYTANLSLSPSIVSALKVTSLATDKQTYNARENVSITAAIENTGVTTTQAMIQAQITDQYGNVLSLVSYPGNPLTLGPGTAETISLQWNTEQTPPGPYVIALNVDDSTAGALAEGKTSFDIAPTLSVDGLVSLISPRFMNVRATGTSNISVYMVNRSNTDGPLSAEYEIEDPDGAVLENGTVNFSLLSSEAFKVANILDFTNTYNQSGRYPITVRILSGDNLIGQVVDAIYVAPSIRIEPSKSLNPASVVPDGDKEIRIEIQIKAVEDKQ